MRGYREAVKYIIRYWSANCIIKLRLEDSWRVLKLKLERYKMAMSMSHTCYNERMIATKFISNLFYFFFFIGQ